MYIIYLNIITLITCEHFGVSETSKLSSHSGKKMFWFIKFSIGKFKDFFPNLILNTDR